MRNRDCPLPKAVLELSQFLKGELYEICFCMLMALGASGAQAEVYTVSSADPAVLLASLSIGQPARRYSARVRNCAESINSVMLRVSEAGLQVTGGVWFLMTGRLSRTASPIIFRLITIARGSALNPLSRTTNV